MRHPRLARRSTTFTPRELLDLADRASTLRERLSTDQPDGGERGSPVINWRLRRWREIAADGDKGRFATRLRLDGLDDRSVRAALAPVPPRIHTDPPGWAILLNECVAASSGEADVAARRMLNPEKPLPFEELLVVFAAVAARRVNAAITPHIVPVPPQARVGLERQLLERLTSLAGESLQAWFSVFRWNEEPGGWLARQAAVPRGNANGAADEQHSRTSYLRFIETMGRGELLQFFEAYPVLARLLGTAMLHWVEASAEFVLRLQQDGAELHRMFGGGDVTPVVAIEAGLSDPHHHGRTVVRVTFASGVKAIYKPRSVALEAAWGRLQQWINLHEPPALLEVTATIARGGYGWMPFIEHAPCHDDDEAARFFARAGMLHCLFILLGASDCHMGNMIACGEHPVLVDAECVFQRERPQDRPGEARGSDETMLDDAFRSGFLSLPAASRSELDPDLSGLSGRGFQQTGDRVALWRHTNTDAMTLLFVPGATAEQKNRPVLHGRSLSPARFATDLSEGFAAMCRFVERYADTLLACDGPLPRRDDGVPRLLIRSTREYVAILNRSLRPACFRDGVERSLALDELARVHLRTAAGTALWPRLRDETAALERLDIPRFNADDGDVDAPGAVKSRLQRLASGEGERQTRLLKALATLTTIDE